MGLIKLNKKKEEKKEVLPVIKEKKYDNKKIIHEIESKKNEYIDTYLLNDGTYEQVITSEASNYYDEEENKYKSIDNDLILDGDVYRNKEGKYSIEISESKKGNNVCFSKKGIGLTWEYLGKKDSSDELVLDSKLKVENHNRRNSRIKYENIEVDSDIEYVLSGNNLKENIIVKEKSDEYVYSFMLDTKGLSLKLSSDKTKIELYKDNKVEFVIPSPYMYDSNGEVSEEVYYEVETVENNKYVFSVIADSKWINSSERKLPVIIDPQITEPSEKVISWKVESRTVKPTGVTGWAETTEPNLRVFNNGILEVRSIITINKELINEYIGEITEVKLYLKTLATYTGTVLVDGVGTHCNVEEIVIDKTIEYKVAGDKLDIILTSNCSEDIKFDVTTRLPKLVITYMENEHINHVKKTFNLANIATSELNLVTGDLVTSIPTVSIDLALGVPIYHVYKKGVEDYNLGRNLKLNLHEKLVKYEGLYYTYIDSNGYKHIVREFNYYKDENDNRVYITDKENIEVNTNGSLKYSVNGKDYNVYREYKSTVGLKVLTELSDYKYIDYVEQRTEEIKSLEEQIKNYEKVLKEYVIYDSSISKDIFRLSDFSENTHAFVQFLNMLKLQDTYYLLSKTEIKNYDNLDVLNISSENIQLIKDYYKEYSLLKERLNNLYLIVPINYLTDGKIFKGFNKEGDLVLIQDMYENYVVIEYEKYLFNNTYQKRISRVYDNYNRCAVLNYSNESHLLSSITDTRGRKTSFGYIDGYLVYVTYDTGEHIVISYTTDDIASVIEDKRGYKAVITYENNRPSIFTNYSYYKVISKNALSNELNEISKTRITYALSTEYDVEEVSIINNLSKETYYFDENGFNTEYRLYKNSQVVKALKYEYTPYWKGAEKQSNPKSVVTSTTKDSLYKSSFTFSVGDVVTIELNEDNKPSVVSTSNIAISDSLNQQITINYTYDDNERLIKETTITKYITTEGLIIKTYTHVKTYHYNLASDVIKTVSYVEGEELINGKMVEEVVYDNKGNVVKSFSYNTLESSNKFYKECEFNNLGQVVKELDSLGINKKLYEYINNSNIIQNEILPNGSVLSYGYDIDDTITSITKSTNEGEENCNNQILRCGEVVEVNSGNNNIKYKFDHKRRITNVELNGIVDYVVNTYEETISNGNIIKVKVTSTYKNGTVVTSEFSSYGELIRSTEQGHIYFEKTKDKITYMSDGVAQQTTDIIYDDYDNLISYERKDMNSDTIIKETNTYDSNGKLNNKVCSGVINHNYSFMYSSDSSNILRRIGFCNPNHNYSFEPLFDKLGRINGKRIYNDLDVIIEEKISYLKQGDHTTNIPQCITFVGTSDNIRYAFDKMGNITKVYENGELAVRYLYDNLNRLIREDNKVLDKTVLMAYDSNGNIINKRTTSFTLKDSILVEELDTNDVAYIYDGDKLLLYGDESITYDVLGRPTSYMGKAITWAKVNQITKIDDLEFKYDSLGRRIKKGNIEFVYDSNNRLIKQGDLEFFYDHTGLAGIINGNVLYFYRKNAQGDVIALVDRSGNVVVKYVYDAWGNHKIYDNEGNEINNSSHIGVINPFRYRGYYYDEETELFYCNSRYYSPELGRFLQVSDVSELNPHSINGETFQT